jgi:hypothetical protein
MRDQIQAAPEGCRACRSRGSRNKPRERGPWGEGFAALELDETTIAPGTVFNVWPGHLGP